MTEHLSATGTFKVDWDWGTDAQGNVIQVPIGGSGDDKLSTMVEAADGGLPLWVEYDAEGPPSEQQRIAEGRVIRRATEREAADFFASSGGGGATSSPAALRNAQTAAERLQFDIQQAGQLSPAQIAQIELSQDQLQQRIAESDQDAATAAQNLTFLRDKLAAETRDNDRSAMLATRSLMESITARMERTQLERAGLVQQAQGLQAQLTQQANIANQAATAQAEQINEQRRQFNLSQQRGVATDIAEAAVSPGDVGRQAALLLAGTGGSPISTALAEGEDFRTPMSVQGLDLLLRTRAELAHGPEQFDPTLINAPNVPIPRFGQVQSPDFASLLASMGLGGTPTALGTAPPAAAAPPPMQAPSTTDQLRQAALGTERNSAEALAFLDRLKSLSGQELLDAISIPQAAHGGTYRNKRTAAAAHGGAFRNRPSGSRPPPTSLGRRELPVIEGQSRPVDTDSVVVGEPAPNGRARPELLRLAPGAEVDVQPLTDDAGRPLNTGVAGGGLPLARDPLPIRPGVTLPAQAADRAREAVTAAGVTGELRQRAANRPLLPGPEQLEPVGQPALAVERTGFVQQPIDPIEAERRRSAFSNPALLGQPARAAHGGTFTNELLAGPGSTQVEPGIDFLNRAFRLAMSRLPFGRLPLPVELSTPGTSRFVQEAGASVAALGRGVNPEQFLEEARRITPRGIPLAAQRRTG
ncbi:hypothetical protein LCGC14_0391580 [marine sediment metagenome]|uniref:Uncharacterized protein n=1 Tax=marine sediment metagenome TaxID=412755 RepID=A0A0F9THJ0_9ZZZZ